MEGCLLGGGRLNGGRSAGELGCRVSVVSKVGTECSHWFLQVSGYLGMCVCVCGGGGVGNGVCQLFCSWISLLRSCMLRDQKINLHIYSRHFSNCCFNAVSLLGCYAVFKGGDSDYCPLTLPELSPLIFKVPEVSPADGKYLQS